VVFVETQSTAGKPVERMMIYKFYAALMRLYPRQFHADFGVEMEEVFKQATCESKTQALKLFIRELRDFPTNLVRQHWAAIRKEETPMTTISSTQDLHPQITERQPGSWGAAILAGLPHLIMGLLTGLGKLLVFDAYDPSEISSQVISMVLGIGLGILVMALLLIAWRRGWPLWSASWYLHGTWVILATLSILIESLNLNESWRYTNALLFGWIIVCITGYFVIVSKSKLHGLLSVAFLFPMLSVTMFEFIPNPIEGWFALGVGLSAALAAGYIVRVGNFRSSLILVLGFNLAVGLAWAYISEYRMLDLPYGIPAHVPKFSNFLEYLAIYSIFGLGVVAIPFILRSLWNFGRNKLAS
jgi:hypothetical protein